MRFVLNRYFLFLGLIFYCSAIDVYAQCSASFNTTPGSHEICDNQSVQFTLTSNSVITQRTWNFGDGTATSGSSNPSHIFTTPKDTIYKISLIVKCSNGLRDTSTVNIKVFSRPNADFSSSKLSLCAISDSACFTNLSSNSAGVTYLWDFGDLAISTDYSTCHTYYTSGDFDVELRAIKPSSQGSCQQKVIKTISVKESPNPDFDLTPSNGCLPFNTIITNNTQSRTNIVEWAWDFGDGTSYSGVDPGSKAYTVAGTYVVKLSTSNTTGCKNFTSLPIFVSNAPTVSINTPPNVCPNAPVTITGTTNAMNAFYTWNTSGGQIISGNGTNSIVVKWALGGTKSITLDVDQNGCVVSRTTYGYVFPETNLRAFYPNGNVVCDGGSIDVQVLPTLLPLYTFYKGNATLLATSVSGILLSNLITDTSLNVKITDANNCTFSANISGTVKAYPVLTVTSSPSFNICPGMNATISALPTGLNNYTFLLNSSSVQSGVTASFSKSDFQDNDKIQVIGTLNGCADTSSLFKIIVFDSLGTAPPVVNCGTSTINSVEFVWNSIAGASFYKVSVDNGPFITPSSGSLGLLHQVTGLSGGQNVTISVMIVRNNPCPDTVISQVLTCTAINCAGITFNLKYDNSFCIGDNIVLSATGIKGVTNTYLFNWNGFSTQDSVYSILAKDLFTIPGQVLSVTLSDPSLSPCPSFRQVSYGIEVTKVPALVLSSFHSTAPCAMKDTVTIASSPSRLDTYEYYINNISLPGITTPIADIYMKDTLPHQVKVRGIDNTCIGPFSIITIKGVNIVKYTSLIKPADPSQLRSSDPGGGGSSSTICSKQNSSGDPVQTSGSRTLEVSMATEAFLVKIIGVDTSFLKPDSAIFYKQGVSEAIYRGIENIITFTGPAENSTFSSKVYYQGCYYPSENNLNITVIQSPSPPVIVPGNGSNPPPVTPPITSTGTPISDDLKQRGLIEQTCTYNKFYYNIYPRSIGISFEIKADSGVVIQQDSDYSFFATVSALGTQNSKKDSTNEFVYELTKYEYDKNRSEFYDQYFSAFKDKYDSLGLTSVEIIKKAKFSADSLLYTNSAKNFAKIANAFATNSIKIVSKSNDCPSEPLEIKPRQGVNFHSIIEGDTISCYASRDFNLNFVSINLTQPNDTITFTETIHMQHRDSIRHIGGTYVQYYKTVTGFNTNAFDVSSLTFLNNYQNESDSIKVLPPFVFKSYFPAIHDIRIKNQRGCYLDYTFTTIAKKTTKSPLKIDLRLCVNDVIDGTKIKDSISLDNQTYNYWYHPYVTVDTINNKYIFKPDINIGDYKSIMRSCDVPDTTGTCCVDQAVTGCIMDCEDFQYIPNAISPNGDNVNDIWKIFGFRNPKVEVFNRWGELVYHSDKYMNDWEGKATNGQPFPDGVYSYIIYPQGQFTMNTQSTHHILGISPDDYIKQNEDKYNNHEKGSSEGRNPNSSDDPTATVTRQLPNHDQIPDLRYLDPKTKASYYFCKKISFNELRGTLIIQR